MVSFNEAEELLKSEYHTDNFKYLIDEVLLTDYVKDEHDVIFDNDIFSSVKKLGDSKSCELTIFEVQLKQEQSNNRIRVTQGMFRILRGLHTNNAIVAFVNPDKNNYRISLLTSKYEFEDGKIVKIFSSPHRYSYSLGVGTKTKTAYKLLIESGRVKSLDELKSRFSIEAVNKQFYSEISLAFTSLVGGERGGKKYNRVLNLYSIVDKNKYAEFGVRLIGRIMFCRFLKEKRSKQGIPLVPDDMLSIEKVNSSENYYHEVLEPLFFELLNKRQKSRKEEFLSDNFNKIPYLNGGLFRPDPCDLYEYHGFCGCTIPNDWFEKFYSVLNEYNFTVDEDTAYDVELSIDPEMLGRIFENLLAEINPETSESIKKNNKKKDTGSFYTPRDVVDYMVDSSVYKYLHSKTKIDEIRLKALTSYSKEDDHIAKFSDIEKKEIVNALYDIKTCDIACGSGAFSIGMLQKLVYVLQEVDPDANLWFDKVTENLNPFIKREFEKKFNSGSLNYIRKLSVLKNSVFGVDIQPIAVGISKLRCFLSIIIEEEIHDDEENRGINPLPNLDFKFIIANSLINLDYNPAKNYNPNQGTFFEDQSHMDSLKEIRERYFNATESERHSLVTEFCEVQQDMLLKTIEKFGKEASKKYARLYSWKPFKNELTDWFDAEWMFGVKDGFDIIIGNPPYIQLQKENSDGKKFGQIYKDCGFETFEKSGDIYCLFFEKGYNLLKNGGILSFITSNKWMRAGYGKKLRKFFSEKTNPLVLIDFTGVKVFESSTVDVNILIFEKSKNMGETMAVIANESSRKDLSDYVQKNHLTINFNTSENWIIISPIEKSIKEKIEKYGTPLKDWDIKINYGIKTGLNEAFIISGEKKDELIAKDPKSAEIIKPILRGKDIKKNGYKFADLWLICTHNGIREENKPRIDIEDYPAIKEHLDKYYSSLAKRSDKGDTPYNLRNCAYIEEFYKPKIVYQELAQGSPFCYDENKFFISNTAYMITGENIESLILVLNSKLIEYVFQKYYSTSLGEGSMRWLKQYINNLPIVSIKSKVKQYIEDIQYALKSNDLEKYRNTQHRCDRIVYNLYHLDDDEIKYIEDSLSEKGAE